MRGFSGATWNFREAGLGRGIPDGVRGTLKRAADDRVGYGAGILNSKLFVDLNKSGMMIQLYV